MYLFYYDWKIYCILGIAHPARPWSLWLNLRNVRVLFTALSRISNITDVTLPATASLVVHGNNSWCRKSNFSQLKTSYELSVKFKLTLRNHLPALCPGQEVEPLWAQTIYKPWHGLHEHQFSIGYCYPLLSIVIEGYKLLPCHPCHKTAPLTVYILNCFVFSGRSRGVLPARPPRVQILSFWHTNFLKWSHLRSWHPPTRLVPPMGNPGSAAGLWPGSDKYDLKW